MDNPGKVDTHVPSEPMQGRRATELLVLFVVFILVFALAGRTPLDSDFWWHLRAGEQTLSSGHIVLTDQFSYTRAGAEWNDHSWLAELGLALLYRWGGFVAISMATAAIATASLVCVLPQMEAPALLKAFVLVLAAIVSSFVWSPRPQTASLLLFALVGWILYNFKWKDKDRLWWLPPVFILWSNLHAGYVLGLLAIGAMILGECLNHVLCISDGVTLSWRQIRKLILVGVVCGIAVLINPNGINTWLVPFQTINVSSLQNLISEWASPDFHDIGQQSLLWLTFACAASFGLSGRGIDGTDLVSYILFGYMAFVARRNFGPFALVAAPILARHLWPACKAVWARFMLQKRTSAERLQAWMDKINRPHAIPAATHKAINLSLVGLLTFITLIKVYAVSNPSVVGAYLPREFPSQAVQWIDQNRPGGRLLSSYNWGGYLIWSLPKYPVFVDGRTDLFNDEIIDQWLQVVNAQPGWKDVLNKWGVNLVLLEPDRPVIGNLERSGWKLLYADKMAVLYGR